MPFLLGIPTGHTGHQNAVILAFADALLEIPDPYRPAGNQDDRNRPSRSDEFLESRKLGFSAEVT
jgi:hypothetical protein